MSSSAYIKISSSDRINPGTTSPGQFTINSNFVFSKSYLLKAIYYPSAFWNINQNNNQIYFTESAVNKVATIPPGTYSIVSLPAAVAACMTTASGGTNTFTVAQNALSSFLTITASTVAFSLTFATNQINSASQVLGFTQINTASALVSTGTTFPNLSPLRSLNINISGISAIKDTKGNSQCTLCVPILSNSPNGLGYYEPPLHFPQIITFNSPTSNLNISVLDDLQNIIAMQAEWHMIVESI
jgi:hypothetical protein